MSYSRQLCSTWLAENFKAKNPAAAQQVERMSAFCLFAGLERNALVIEFVVFGSLLLLHVRLHDAGRLHQSKDSCKKTAATATTEAAACNTRNERVAVVGERVRVCCYI